MKSLFEGDDYSYTDNAFSLTNEISKALFPIFKKWVDLGFSPSEIQCIIHREVTDAALGNIRLLKMEEKTVES